MQVNEFLKDRQQKEPSNKGLLKLKCKMSYDDITKLFNAQSRCINRKEVVSNE